MTKFMEKKFSVAVGGSAYSAGWERCFGQKTPEILECGDCDGHGADRGGDDCTTCKGKGQFVVVPAPESEQPLKPTPQRPIKLQDLERSYWWSRNTANEKWENGNKESATERHKDADNVLRQIRDYEKENGLTERHEHDFVGSPYGPEVRAQPAVQALFHSNDDIYQAELKIIGDGKPVPIPPELKVQLDAGPVGFTGQVFSPSSPAFESQLQDYQRWTLTRWGLAPSEPLERHLCNAVLGLVGEAEEAYQCVISPSVTEESLNSELGDCFFYITIFCHFWGVELHPLVVQAAMEAAGEDAEGIIEALGHAAAGLAEAVKKQCYHSKDKDMIFRRALVLYYLKGFMALLGTPVAMSERTAATMYEFGQSKLMDLLGIMKLNQDKLNARPKVKPLERKVTSYYFVETNVQVPADLQVVVPLKELNMVYGVYQREGYTNATIEHCMTAAIKAFKGA